jgi:hypothetical protein
MIDWLGARKPLEIIFLMTAALALMAAGVEQLVIPAVTSATHAN